MAVVTRTAKALAFVAVAVLCLGATSDSTRDALPNTTPPVPNIQNALFFEDFSDGLARWQPDREGVWTIRRGMLRADLPDGKQERSFLYAGDETWGDVAVDLDVCMMRGVDKGIAVRVQGNSGIGIDLRGSRYQDVVVNRREWRLGRAPINNPNGMWHHVRVEARGHSYSVLINGERVLAVVDGRKSLATGRIALPAYTGGFGQCTVYYDNILVTSLAADSMTALR